MRDEVGPAFAIAAAASTVVVFGGSVFLGMWAARRAKAAGTPGSLAISAGIVVGFFGFFVLTALDVLFFIVLAQLLELVI